MQLAIGAGLALWRGALADIARRQLFLDGRRVHAGGHCVGIARHCCGRVLHAGKLEAQFFNGVSEFLLPGAAMICCQGLLLVLVGMIYKHFGDIARAWQVAFGVNGDRHDRAGGVSPVHSARNRSGDSTEAGSKFFQEFMRTFEDFFAEAGIGRMILFLLCYRLGEVQLTTMGILFLKDFARTEVSN